MGLFGNKESNPADLYDKGMNLLDKGRHQKAVACLNEAGELGYAEAQFILGNMYYGDGKDDLIVKQDHVNAAQWYLKAAEQGHMESQKAMGLLYYNGDGVKQDFTKAAYWLEKAAEQGDADSQNSIGEMYRQGEGVEQDSDRAIYWYEAAIENGDGIAAYRLAAMYYHGDGVARDYSKALELLNSINIDYSEDDPDDLDDLQGDMQYYLALIYKEGGYGAKRDLRLAVEWAGLAAFKGSEEAVQLLRELEEYGLIKRYSKLSGEELHKATGKMEITKLPCLFPEEDELLEILEINGKEYAALDIKFAGYGLQLLYLHKDSYENHFSDIEDMREWSLVKGVYEGLVDLDEHDEEMMKT